MTLRQLNIAWLVPIGAVLLGVITYLIDPLPLQVLRNSVFDQYQRWAPRNYQETPIRIIDIDEDSLARLGQWPWPRTRIAELVDRLRDAGAAAIVFDMMFAEPDRTSPAAQLRIWNADPPLAAMLARLPDHDAVLGRSIARGDVVLGHALTREGRPPAHFATPYRIVDVGPSALPFLHTFSGTVAALPNLQDAAAGNGAISFVPDSDGVVRRVPLLLKMGDRVVPSLVAEALRVAQGGRNYLVKTAAEEGVGVEEIRVGDLTVPTSANGELWVRYTPHVAGRYIPAWQALTGQVSEDLIQGRILLVGSSAQGLMDLRFSPLRGTMPGVEAHAQALEQILTGEYMQRPGWASALEVLGIVLGGLLVGYIGLWAGATLSAMAAALTLAVTGWGGWLAYVNYSLLLDPLTPGLTLLVIFMLTSLLHHAATEQRQRWVKQAFARYLSPNLVNFLVNNPDNLELGGTRRECSFIFTDLADFTSLMETLDPSEAVTLLNNYLDNMINIAFKHDGTLDRIVGDAVAIMFSAPLAQADHRQRALRCAMDMHRFASGYAALARARGIPFGSTRIGIHSGEVTVGNFGGSTIFDYRALGDPVNTAARLESVNKQLGTLVCVSESTLSGCECGAFRPIGRLVLKGKTQPLMVYEPVIAEGDAPPERDLEYEAVYALMAGNAPEALEACKRLAAMRPHDPLVKFHLDRLSSGQAGDLIVFSEK